MVLTLCNMVYLCYSCFGASMLFMMCIHLRLSITVIKSGSNPAYSRRQSTPSVMANYCLVSLSAMPQAFVSYEFLSSSSGNTSFSHTSLHPILTKLGQSDQYLDHYSGTDNDGVRGHDGVTGVKN